MGAARSLKLEMGQNRLLVLSEQIVRVSVAEPRVADLKVITPTQLLLTAKGVGATDLTLWNRKDEPLVLALEVTRNLEALRKQLKELLPERGHPGDGRRRPGDPVGRGLGRARARAGRWRSPSCTPSKVANLIKVRGNQQVQLEVKFAEVSRSGPARR